MRRVPSFSLGRAWSGNRKRCARVNITLVHDFFYVLEAIKKLRKMKRKILSRTVAEMIEINRTTSSLVRDTPSAVLYMLTGLISPPDMKSQRKESIMPENNKLGPCNFRSSSIKCSLLHSSLPWLGTARYVLRLVTRSSPHDKPKKLPTQTLFGHAHITQSTPSPPSRQILKETQGGEESWSRFTENN